jgi:ribonuclease HI
VDIVSGRNGREDPEATAVQIAMTTKPGIPSAMSEVRLYCDGACRGNPGLGAWAAILVWKGLERELSGVAESTTNNRMELEAAIQGIAALKRPCRLTVVTDSQYVHKGMTQWIEGWKRKGWVSSKDEEVRNRDLWERLDELASRHRTEWVWVRGHDGHEFNERCDELANQAMDRHLASSTSRGRRGG